MNRTPSKDFRGRPSSSLPVSPPSVSLGVWIPLIKDKSQAWGSRHYHQNEVEFVSTIEGLSRISSIISSTSIQDSARLYFSAVVSCASLRGGDWCRGVLESRRPNVTACDIQCSTLMWTVQTPHGQHENQTRLWGGAAWPISSLKQTSLEG